MILALRHLRHSRFSQEDRKCQTFAGRRQRTPGWSCGRGLRARYVSGCGRVLGQERGEVVWVDSEGLELADVAADLAVADLAVAVDLGVVEVRAEVAEPC